MLDEALKDDELDEEDADLEPLDDDLGEDLSIDDDDFDDDMDVESYDDELE